MNETTVASAATTDEPASPNPNPNPFKWTVEFEVDPLWIADGFNLTDETAFEMLNEFLPFAHEHELKARVLSAPDSELIKKEQSSERP